MKLKQILQNLHAEINQSEWSPEFKGGIGGLDALASLLVGGNEGEDEAHDVAKVPAMLSVDDPKRSVSMS